MPSTRREFLAGASAAAALSALTTSPLHAAAEDTATAETAGRDYYELRAYRLKPGASPALLDDYLRGALIPALNTRGVRAVGVFTEPNAPDGPAVWVLIPHASLESIATVNAAINTDRDVLAAGRDYLTSPTRANPAFDRIDSWIMLAFSGMPQFEIPARTRAGQSRVFELRIYESFSELKALKKVEMFNAGEIEVMKELQLSPVFYGQALVGRDLPQLA
ncbi:MAG: NIPSNAP family protein, partial [Gemmatimonadaceae bacterium]|nr:NIPSNAP family protein [Gemmatimonadaceae bacterium]